MPYVVRLSLAVILGAGAALALAAVLMTAFIIFRASIVSPEAAEVLGFGFGPYVIDVASFAGLASAPGCGLAMICYFAFRRLNLLSRRSLLAAGLIAGAFLALSRIAFLLAKSLFSTGDFDWSQFLNWRLFMALAVEGSIGALAGLSAAFVIVAVMEGVEPQLARTG